MIQVLVVLYEENVIYFKKIIYVYIVYILLRLVVEVFEVSNFLYDVDLFIIQCICIFCGIKRMLVFMVCYKIIFLRKCYINNILE